MDILSAFVHVHHGHAVPVEERRENKTPGERLELVASNHVRAGATSVLN